MACLVGSSQGACATLNCALECPKLMHTIAVCHPVGHAPHRYVAITQPSLLIFDTEDAGHPVSVGRQMRKQLPNPRYFEPGFIFPKLFSFAFLLILVSLLL